jgi:hypothetical protein
MDKELKKTEQELKQKRKPAPTSDNEGTTLSQLPNFSIIVI